MEMDKVAILNDLLQWILDSGKTLTQVDREQDLLATGVLDSLGFVKLLTFVEVKYNYRVDLLTADPSNLVTLNGLSSLVVKDHEDKKKSQ